MTVDVFPVLVALAILLGFELALSRAKRSGEDAGGDIARFLIWVIAGGFVGSHLFAIGVDEPRLLAEQPIEILRVWGRLSSVGGMLGGGAGAGLWVWRHRVPPIRALRLLDYVAFALPFAWVVGRAGCALAHDHLGVSSSSWLAVRFAEGPRFDCGLLECFYAVGLSLLTLVVASRKPREGHMLAFVLIAYFPGRLVIDHLRVGEPLHFGATVGQIAAGCAALVGLALILARARLVDRIPHASQGNAI